MSLPLQSPDSNPPTPSTTLTTPDQSPGQDDDIWASDSDHHHHHDSHNHEDGDSHPTRQGNGNRNGTERRAGQEILSDLPTLRRQHMTSGYREGLSVGKAEVMQKGFDDGYPVGVTAGLRVGVLLGVLEGWLASFSSSRLGSKGEVEVEVTEVKKLYERAKEELACTSLLGGLGDEVVAEARGVPGRVLEVLERWEGRVLGGGGRGGRGESEGA